MLQLLVGERVQGSLLGRRRLVAREERPRQIGVVAVTAHGVGVEADELTCFDDLVACFLEPRVRARTGVEESSLEVLASPGDQRAVQFCPDLVLGAAGDQPLLHERDGGLGPGNAARMRSSSVGVLIDLARSMIGEASTMSKPAAISAGTASTGERSMPSR